MNFRKLKKILKRYHYSILHCQTALNSVFYMGYCHKSKSFRAHRDLLLSKSDVKRNLRKFNYKLSLHIGLSNYIRKKF